MATVMLDPHPAQIPTKPICAYKVVYKKTHTNLSGLSKTMNGTQVCLAQRNGPFTKCTWSKKGVSLADVQFTQGYT